MQDKLHCLESADSETTKYSKMLPSLLSPTALTCPFLSFYIQAEITVDWNAADYKLNITDYFPFKFYTQRMPSSDHLLNTRIGIDNASHFNY